MVYCLFILLYIDGRILDLSKFPLLHSLSLVLPDEPSTGALDTVIKLLTHRPPCSPLRTITLVLDRVFSTRPWISHSHDAEQLEEISGKEYRTLYRKIDSILGDQQRDEGDVTSLTLEASYGLPKQIIDQINNLFRSEFPELHRKGRLTIDFTVWGKQFPTQLCAHP